MAAVGEGRVDPSGSVVEARDADLLKSINDNWCKAESKKKTSVGSVAEIDASILNRVQLLSLATYLRCAVPAKTSVPELKKICADSMGSSLLTVQNTIKKACNLIKERTSGGPSSFRSTFSTLIRLVNDYYGPFSREYKTWWVKQGLLNWAKHWCDDHTS